MWLDTRTFLLEKKVTLWEHNYRAPGWKIRGVGELVTLWERNYWAPGFKIRGVGNW